MELFKGQITCTAVIVTLLLAEIHSLDLRHYKKENVFAKNDKVAVAVYYESLCPYSIKFVKEQLWPTYTEMKSVLSVELVPYGKATYSPDGDSWKFTCQHGPDECKGNKLQACAVKLYPDSEILVPFVHCVMASEYPPDSGEQCAISVGLDWNRLSQCFEGTEGNEYLRQMGMKTQNLSPRLVGVPWITINGEHTDEIEDEATDNLKGLVCETYKGSFPGCQ